MRLALMPRAFLSLEFLSLVLSELLRVTLKDAGKSSDPPNHCFVRFLGLYCSLIRRSAACRAASTSAIRARHRHVPGGKKLLRAIVPRRSSVLLCADHMRGRGRDFFAEVCRQDLEGIVAKRADGVYDPALRCRGG